MVVWDDGNPGQGWVDQANLMVVWDAGNPGQGWVDQANLMVVWDDGNPGQGWVDQANLMVVWDDAVIGAASSKLRKLAGLSLHRAFRSFGPTFAGYKIK
jgi:hypothetical protein